MKEMRIGKMMTMNTVKTMMRGVLSVQTMLTLGGMLSMVSLSESVPDLRLTRFPSDLTISLSWPLRKRLSCSCLWKSLRLELVTRARV